MYNIFFLNSPWTMIIVEEFILVKSVGKTRPTQLQLGSELMEVDFSKHSWLGCQFLIRSDGLIRTDSNPTRSDTTRK
jgi:hypothetical protein